MNMHTSTAAADRTLLPRRLIARRRTYRLRWKFRVGEVVEFAHQIAVVSDRSISALGHQSFTRHMVGESHGRPVRVVRAEYIRDIPTLKVVGIYTPLIDHDSPALSLVEVV